MRIASVLILVLVAAVAFASDNAPWVDMENCPVCKNITAQEGLLENMTWEHHLTATGVMTVSTVKPEFQPQYAKAKAGMQKEIGRVMAGEDIKVCDYCTSISSLMMAGAKTENISTKACDIMLISSTDEAIIAKIHAHAQKTIDFLSAAPAGDN